MMYTCAQLCPARKQLLPENSVEEGYGSTFDGEMCDASKVLHSVHEKAALAARRKQTDGHQLTAIASAG